MARVRVYKITDLSGQEYTVKAYKKGDFGIEFDLKDEFPYYGTWFAKRFFIPYNQIESIIEEYREDKD